MVEKIKNEFNSLMHNDNVNKFGFIIDKETDELIYINQEQLIKNVNFEECEKYHCGASSLAKAINPHKTENSQINQLEQMLESERVIIDCANTLMDKNSFDVSITKLLQIICDFYGGNHACLFERDYSTLLSKVTYKYHYKDVNLIDEEFTKSFKFTSDDVWTTHLKENHYAFLQTNNEIDDILYNSSYCKRFMQSNRNNLLVVSLNDNGKILGAIEIDNVTQNLDNINLITTICAFIVNNLHIKNVNEDLKENLEDLKNKNHFNNTILACVETLVYDDDINISMNKLLEVISNYFGANSTNILYKKSTLNNASCIHSYAKDGNIETTKIDDIPLSELIRLYETFQLNGVGYIPCVEDFEDQLKNNFPINYQVLIDKNIKSLLFSPLYHKNDIVGFIGVENVVKNFTECHLVKSIANFVVNQISKNELLNKLEKLSYMDNLTNVYNRNFYNNFIDEFKTHPRKSVGVIFADINALKKTNDSFGHELGDKLIKWSAKFLKTNLNGLIFRIGGDEFVCIVENVLESTFHNIVNDLKEKIDALQEKHMSIGSTWSSSFPDIENIISTADSNMYEEKKKYYQELILDTRTVKESLENLKNSIESL